jgi:quercetin dioxygenase-like cupin family protein
MHQHDRDYVYVMIGSSQVENLKQGAAPATLKLNDGDVKFTKAPITHKVTNTGDTPFVNLTIEVKKASTKAVCGASWAGVPATGTGCAGIGSGSSDGASWSKGRALETDAVSADSVTSSAPFSVDTANGHPILLLALAPSTANEVKTNKSMKVTVVEGKKLEAGNVFWIPANEKFNVVPMTGEQAKFVLVEFQ